MKEKDTVINYTARILKFKKMGEKSGWTYIEIPADVAEDLFPGNKKSFRVKGKLDGHAISGVALLPMGNGRFIMPLNATLRKATGKRDGAMLKVQLMHDTKKPALNRELIKCLKDDPDAFAFFNSLAKSHQNYFSKWIDDAKTNETKVKRIARVLNALVRKMNYAEMLRAGQ